MFNFSCNSQASPIILDMFGTQKLSDLVCSVSAAYHALPESERPSVVWVSSQRLGAVVSDQLRERGVPVAEVAPYEASKNRPLVNATSVV